MSGADVRLDESGGMLLAFALRPVFPQQDRQSR
jgi:hypothetical protein